MPINLTRKRIYAAPLEPESSDSTYEPVWMLDQDTQPTAL